MILTPSLFRDFSGGVVSNLPAGKLTDTLSPRAYNTALRAVPSGAMVVGARPGLRPVVQLTDAVEGTTIVAQAWYHYADADVLAKHHLAVDSTGQLWVLDAPAPVALDLPVGPRDFAATTLADVSQGVLFVQGRNVLVGLVRGGETFKVYRVPGDSTLYVARAGLEAPGVPSQDSILGSGAMYGLVEVRCTWKNSETGTESSASPTLSIDLGGSDTTRYHLRVALPYDPPSDADLLDVYVRVPRLQSRFYRNAAMEIAAPTTNAGGANLYTVALSDEDLTSIDMSIPSPDIDQYQPVPEGMLCATWHLSRLFCSDGVRLYYSQTGNPEQFDASAAELVSIGDGQRILGLRPLTDQVLGVFKERSIHTIAGPTPQAWEIRRAFEGLGCHATRSLCEGDGMIGFWSASGPVVWDKVNPPQLLVHETLEPLVRQGTILLGRPDQCLGTFDPQGHRFLWTLDLAVDDSTPWTLVPWSTQWKTWEAIAWDLPNLTVLDQGWSDASEYRVFLNGPDRDLYELTETARTDGAADEAGTLWTTATASSTTTVTLASSGPFDVNPWSSRARLLDLTTLRVVQGSYTLNDTLLTWDTPLATAPSVGSLVLFDVPCWEWDTIDQTHGAPLEQKRALMAYLELYAQGDARVVLGLFRNNEALPIRVWTPILEANDRQTTLVTPTLSGRQRAFKRWAGVVYRWMRARVIGWYPHAPHALSLVGWQAAVQGDEDDQA